jgi:hypothetical protein
VLDGNIYEASVRHGTEPLNVAVDRNKAQLTTVMPCAVFGLCDRQAEHMPRIKGSTPACMAIKNKRSRTPNW